MTNIPFTAESISSPSSRNCFSPEITCYQDYVDILLLLFEIDTLSAAEAWPTSPQTKYVFLPYVLLYSFLLLFPSFQQMKMLPYFAKN